MQPGLDEDADQDIYNDSSPRLTKQIRASSASLAKDSGIVASAKIKKVIELLHEWHGHRSEDQVEKVILYAQCTMRLHTLSRRP